MDALAADKPRIRKPSQISGSAAFPFSKITQNRALRYAQSFPQANG
jgi:hypothetical protein